MATKRKLLPRVPFHQYVLGELAELLTVPRNDTTAQRALDAAKLTRNVEIPVLHRDAVKKNLTMVMAYFNVKHSKFFTRKQRSHFYGALDALKEKPVQNGDRHASADNQVVAGAGQVAL